MLLLSSLLIIIISLSVIWVVYLQDIIHKFIQKIMALLFLPAQHILSMFVRIESLVLSNGKMCEFINYIRNQVVVFHCWTVYITSVSAIIGWGCFGMVPLMLPPIPDSLYHIGTIFSVSSSKNPSWHYYLFYCSNNYTNIMSRIDYK